MATATRWVMDLALVDMRWISDEGVRCGREDVAEFGEGVGGESEGGVLGDVVEIVRMEVVGLEMLDRMCNGMGKSVVASPRVVDFDVVCLLIQDAGCGWKYIGIGWVLAGKISKLSKVSIQKAHERDLIWAQEGREYRCKKSPHTAVSRSTKEISDRHIHSSLRIQES